MLKKILLVVISLTIVLVAIVAMQPSEFTVSRSLVISASDSAIFGEINNNRNFQKWSPWVKFDPEAKIAFEGPESGVGAIYSWEGDKLGKGSSEIVGSTAYNSVAMKVTMEKPFSSVNSAEFKLEPQGTQTKVTWTFQGKKTFMTKLMGLVNNCEKMIGEQFEKGLSNLEGLVENKKQEALAAEAAVKE